MNLKFLLVLIIWTILGSSIYAQREIQNIKEAQTEIKQLEEALKENADSILLDANSELTDYLKIAAINNPKIMSAFYKWKSDVEKTGYAGALPDPVFMYSYFIENVETRVGPQNQKFSLRQTIPWIGTLGAKKNIALAGSNISYKKFQAEQLNLFYQVKVAYYDYYYLGREIEITRDNIELLKFWESVVRTKYKVGLSQHPDVIKAQVELGKLEEQQLTLKDRITPVKARLAALLNISNLIEIPIPELISFDEMQIENDTYIDEIIEHNPNINAVKQMIEQENHAIRLADKSSLPNFTFGIDYIETGEALNPTLSESGKDPIVASVGINIPLWFGKNNAKKNEAKAKKKSVEYLLLDKKNQLRAITEDIIFQHNNALRKIQLYRDGLIPKAEQSLHAAYASYQAGYADFLNVLDAQRELLDFQLKLDMSITNIAKRKAELDMLTGSELNRKQ